MPCSASAPRRQRESRLGSAAGRDWVPPGPCPLRPTKCPSTFRLAMKPQHLHTCSTMLISDPKAGRPVLSRADRARRELPGHLLRGRQDDVGCMHPDLPGAQAPARERRVLHHARIGNESRVPPVQGVPPDGERVRGARLREARDRPCAGQSEGEESRMPGCADWGSRPSRCAAGSIATTE